MLTTRIGGDVYLLGGRHPSTVLRQDTDAVLRPWVESRDGGQGGAHEGGGQSVLPVLTSPLVPELHGVAAHWDVEVCVYRESGASGDVPAEGQSARGGDAHYANIQGRVGGSWSNTVPGDSIEHKWHS